MPTLAVAYADDVGRSFGSHADGIGYRNVCLEGHDLNQLVHGGDTTCQGRMVSQLADTVLNDVAWVVHFAVVSGIFQSVGYQTGLFYAFYLIDRMVAGRWIPSAMTSTVIGSVR